MKEPKIFFTARWEYLLLLTYKVDPDILEEYIPKGLILDTIDGNSFVSLVAFSFFDTKVKGIKVPLHVNFPEINLRFYVKETPDEASRRGVVFIREFVPRKIISLFANKLYNENYRTHPMNSVIETKPGNVSCSYSVKIHGKQYSVRAEAENKPIMPPVDSTEHFFKEHEWGFGRTRQGEKLVYRVQHPFWEVYPVIGLELDLDYGNMYGKKWKFLNSENPYNITLAKGSLVKVYSAEK